VRVVADLHHGVLWEAHAILFEDLFGWELIPWVDGHYVTEPGPLTVDFPPREIVAQTTEQIELANLVIATTSVNRSKMKTLAQELGGRYLDHVGNAWDAPISDHCLRSVQGDYGLLYHPEFHRVPYRKPKGNRIGAFHGSLAVSPCRSFWDKAIEHYPQYDFQLYGTTENPLYPWQVSKAMRDCLAIWHDKDADGYGFTVHEAFASGRTIIAHGTHYDGKLAGALFEKGATYLEPDDDLSVLDMGAAARARFEALVDFDAEADAIRSYLEVLLP
jgi:hypothetical protein